MMYKFYIFYSLVKNCIFGNRMIDTHAHIYADEFMVDREDALMRAYEHQLKAIYMPNIDHTSIDAMLEVHHLHPHFCFPMIGLHPCSVTKHVERELYLVENWLQKNRSLFKGIGETGLDHYWDKTYVSQQADAFSIQLGFATSYDLPIIIHSRDAMDLAIDLVKKNKTEALTGIFHCFTGTLQQALAIIDLGFYLGIGGVLTFKNAGLAEIIRAIDLKYVVLETDSPYLSPVPYRGKRNEPSYISYVAQQLASIKNIPLPDVVEITSANAKKIFL